MPFNKQTIALATNVFLFWYHTPYFVKRQKGKTCETKKQVISMFLVHSIFDEFGGRLFQQIINISRRKPCVLLFIITWLEVISGTWQKQKDRSSQIIVSHSEIWITCFQLTIHNFLNRFKLYILRHPSF